MTCIVGVIHDTGGVTMGGDSAATSGWERTIMAQPKVFRVSGAALDMLIGVTGYPRVAQLLRHALKVPEHPVGVSVEEYLSTLFVDAVRECLKAAGFAKKESEQEKADQTSFLLAYCGRLFEVESNYQWVEPAHGFHAIGSGGEYARGVLYATRTLNFSPRERARMALEAAAVFNIGVCAPFTFEVLEPYAHVPSAEPAVLKVVS